MRVKYYIFWKGNTSKPTSSPTNHCSQNLFGRDEQLAQLKKFLWSARITSVDELRICCQLELKMRCPLPSLVLISLCRKKKNAVTRLLKKGFISSKYFFVPTSKLKQFFFRSNFPSRSIYEVCCASYSKKTYQLN